MRILLYKDNPWQHTLSSPWIKALETLGHDVQVFSQMHEMYAGLGPFNLPVMQRLCLWRLREKSPRGILKSLPVKALAPLLSRIQDKMNRAFEEVANEYSPELIIVLKGLGIYPETLKRLRSRSGGIIVNFNGDDPHNFYSSNRNVLGAIPLYDCVFTWSKSLVDLLLEDGASRVEYLPFGCNPDLSEDVAVTQDDSARYGSDITFVGTWDREREKSLEGLSDLNLGIWGPYWNRVSRKSGLAMCVRGGAVDLTVMEKIYRSSKVVINLMRPQNHLSHNMKTFEIPAMGGFMLAPGTMEHMEIFEEGKEVAFYDSMEAMRKKAIYFSENDKERAAMARLARQKVLSNHTYIDRMRQLINTLFG
jgi:hypothetical protein